LCCGFPIPKTLGIEEHRTIRLGSPHLTARARENVQFDVYVSYARIDDQPLTPGEKGWITRFHATLKAILSMRMGREAKIWRDEKLQGNDVFSDEIVSQ